MESRRLARAEQRLQQRLQILNVRWRALVQDDQIDRELLHPPVLVRAEELPHDAHVLGLVDLNEHDREVARNPVSPQRVGAARMTREDVRGGPERPVRVEIAAGMLAVCALWVALPRVLGPLPVIEQRQADLQWSTLQPLGAYAR